MNLTELTNYVWKQTDTTEFDLNADTIASYLDEAFDRTIAGENRWPYYEATWTVTCPAGEVSAPLDIDVNPPAIISVISIPKGNKLTQIAPEEAERRWDDNGTGAVSEPWWYSIWGRSIWLWPNIPATEDTNYKVRGYRRPLMTFGQDGQVDADPRLHKPLAHYAIALAYAAQEDEYLENTYMSRWQRDVEMARQAIMDPNKNRPIVMYGNFPRTPVGGYKMRTGRWLGGVNINPPGGS